MSGLTYYKIKFFSKTNDEEFLASLGFWAPDETSLETLFLQSDQGQDYNLIFQKFPFVANTRIQGFGLFDAEGNVVCVFNDEGTLLTFSRPQKLKDMNLDFLKENKPNKIPIAHIFNRLLSKIQNG